MWWGCGEAGGSLGWECGLVLIVWCGGGEEGGLVGLRVIWWEVLMSGEVVK